MHVNNGPAGPLIIALSRHFKALCACKIGPVGALCACKLPAAIDVKMQQIRPRRGLYDRILISIQALHASKIGPQRAAFACILMHNACIELPSQEHFNVEFGPHGGLYAGKLQALKGPAGA